LALAAGLAAVLAAVVVVVIVSSGGPLPANERAAQASARAMLASVTLPRGAKRSAGEPAGDGGVLSLPAETLQPGRGELFFERGLLGTYPPVGPAEPTATLGGWHVVDEAAFWTVDAPLETVVSDFATSSPSASTGAASAVPRQLSLTASLELPAVPNVLPAKRLVMTAKRLADGRTGVRVDAQVVWVKPVLVVPVGTQLSVVITPPDGASHSMIITSPQEVHSAATLLNGLDLVPRDQDRFLGDDWCERGGLLLSFSERRGLSPLARATVDPCGDVVRLTIDGHAEPILDGSSLDGTDGESFVTLLASTLHLNLSSVGD